MITRNLIICFCLGLLAMIMSCESPTNNTESEDQTVNEIPETGEIETEAETIIPDDQDTDIKSETDLKAEAFVQNLESGTELNTFFSDNWTFIFHTDDRTGTTEDGQIDNLKRMQIDTIIKLVVYVEGDNELGDYDLDFDIKQQITHWDRFEAANYNNTEEHIKYILGAGDSDYLILHYSDSNLIVKMEYRSEDPG